MLDKLTDAIHLAVLPQRQLAHYFNFWVLLSKKVMRGLWPSHLSSWALPALWDTCVFQLTNSFFSFFFWCRQGLEFLQRDAADLLLKYPGMQQPCLSQISVYQHLQHSRRVIPNERKKLCFLIKLRSFTIISFNRVPYVAACDSRRGEVCGFIGATLRLPLHRQGLLSAYLLGRQSC